MVILFYATIQELIDSVEDMEISYRKLHTGIHIKNKDEIIKVPYQSIVRTYLPYFKDMIVTAELTPEELSSYKFKPKKLSYDLYGTTEIWCALLELNNVYSIIDFTMEKPKVFDPKEFIPLMNEILILENIIT